MEHISEVIAPIVARLDPHRRSPIYQAHGARVMNRAGVPHWMTVEEAEREGFRLMALLVKAEDPGDVLPLVNQLAWAIHDARDAGGHPTPPAAIAKAA